MSSGVNFMLSRTSLSAVLVGIFALCSCRNEHSIGQREQVTIAGASYAALIQLPLLLAKELGFFADEGLQVEFNDMSGASKALEALTGGSADVVSSLPD